MNKFQKFNKLPKARQRRLILLDVLRQIKLPKTCVTTGTYCDIRLPEVDPFAGDKYTPLPVTELHTLLPKIERCSVCAKGALFLSTVAKSNDFMVHDPQGRVTVHHAGMLHKLKSIWPEKNLALVECAFEKDGRFGIDNIVCSDAEIARAVTFGEAFEDDTARLSAIVRNMLKNNGLFKPTAVKK